MTGHALFVHASSDLYGSDLVALAVAEEAIAQGWTVEFNVPQSGPLVGRLEAIGATVWTLDPLKPRRADLKPSRLPQTARRWIGNWRRVRQRANSGRADVVYTTTAPTLGGWLFARRWGVRHVYHVHEIFWFPPVLVRAFERVLARADDIVCCSRAALDQFEHPEVRRRARVVYSGAAADPAAEVVPFSLERRPLLINVARLNEWKGQEVLVDAVALLRDEGIDVELSLVGGVYASEHHYEHALRDQIARLGLGDRVRLEGERRDAHELLAQADVFVLPSRRPEPFGMALVEAMALGRPVIATAAGGPAEIVTDSVDGLLVPPNDAGALASAIRRLVADPDFARRLADAGRRRSADFRLDEMARQVVGGFAAVPASEH